MQRCASCGGNVPDNALFCGCCGSTFNPAMARRMVISNYPTAILPVMLSDAVMPTVITGEQAYRQVDDGYDMVEQVPLGDTGHKEWQRHSMLAAAASAGMLVDDGLASFGNAPMVQGIPLMNGMPMVQGSPALSATLSNGLPGEDAFYGHSSTSSPVTPPTTSGQYFPYQPATPSWGLPPVPLSASQAWHKQRSRHRAGKSYSGNALLKSVLISVASLLILVTFVGILLAVFPPTLTLNGILSGSAVVTSGGSLPIYGSRFVPLSTVDLTLDNGVSFARTGTGANGEARYDIVRVPHIHEQLAHSKVAPYALSLMHASQAKSLGAFVTTGIDGTFNVTIAVSTQWALGPHTIHARERLTGRETSLSFRVVAQKSMLHVNSTTLDFGNLQAGNKATLPVVISNAGPQTLTWTADVGGVAWLKLQSNLGKIEAGGLEQVLNVTVDASHLAPRHYAAPVHIMSSGGNAVVNIVVEVVPNTGKPQMALRVTPSTLSFGTLGANQQATLLLEIANVGAKSLNWHVSTGGANWLVLDTSTGTIQPGGIPQTIHVTVDTTRLTNQRYSATLQINSNDGNTSVQATLIVTGATSAPGTPTPDPTPKPPPTLIVSPSGFNANTDCSYNRGQGWTCAATLSNLKNTQGPLSWSVTGLGVNGVTLTPSNGNLSPGQSTRVSIFVPNTVCPATADFTFSGSGNVQDVLWGCAAPQISASPTALGNSCVSCVVTLSLAQGAQGNANWSASSQDLAGVTFFPSQGVLLAGQSLQVVIKIPDTACPPSAAFAFQGPANTAQVTWTCVPAKLTVSPTSLDFGTLQAGKSGTHTVRVGNSGGRPLNWSADTGGTSWLAVSNAGSTLSPGGSTTVNVTVNTTALAPGGYSATVNFSSVGGDVSLVVTVTVTSPPAALKVKPTSLNFSAIQGSTTTSTQVFTVSNVGGQPLTWTAQTAGANWLSIDNTGSTVAPGSAVTVHVTVNPTGLAAGSYSATVRVSSNGGNVQVAVMLTVAASPPVLAVNPTSLTFSNISQGTTSTQTFNVSDTGGQPLTWTAQTDGASSSWLSIDNAGSTINGGTSATIHVTVNTTSLTAGQTYTATITINSNGGGPVQVAIQLTVAAVGTAAL